MKILALELSTARGSIAWINGETLAEETWTNDRKNSAPFFSAVRSMRQRYGLPGTIVVGLGPGSYAGVRIAISAAVGLQPASQARLIGLPSICAMSVDSRRYDVLGDARRQMFFFARVRDGRLLAPPELMSEKDLQENLARAEESVPVFSSDALPQFSRLKTSFPSAMRLAQLAQDANGSFSLPPLEPMYLQEPHITQPKRAVSFMTKP
jgi:tRNA threonylcarbamoyl adenosine modification protein YeaZ